MEPTASDPSVQQQYGMIVGIPHSGQLNALATINLRGERSVTCKGDRDKRPSSGPLPAGSPPVCEEFRKLPDALERASEFDARYGSNPDLETSPCTAFHFHLRIRSTRMDMRSTGGADARYDIDFPARDQTLVAELRSKGAIIYAKSVPTEYNGGPTDPGGVHKPEAILYSTAGYQRSSWAGNPSNPFDTTRAASLGSSSGSGVAVSTNLVMCGVCEETRASCRGPANHNSIALILPHKSLISFLGGAIGVDVYTDRAGIHCRNIKDAAKVLDALRDPKNGYYDSRDIFTTVPRSSVLSKPYAPNAAANGRARLSAGDANRHHPRIHADLSRASRPTNRSWRLPRMRSRLCSASSWEPRWWNRSIPAGRTIHRFENMNPSYTQALAQLLPVIFPEILYR